MLIEKDDTEMNLIEAETLALRALAYVASDEALGPRLLSVTGLDAASLRARAAEPALLGATLDFLMAHEPSLVACAGALGESPAALVSARGML